MPGVWIYMEPEIQKKIKAKATQNNETPADLLFRIIKKWVDENAP